jgi:hypothetical protein
VTEFSLSKAPAHGQGFFVTLRHISRCVGNLLKNSLLKGPFAEIAYFLKFAKKVAKSLLLLAMEVTESPRSSCQRELYMKPFETSEELFRLHINRNHFAKTVENS